MLLRCLVGVREAVEGERLLDLLFDPDGEFGVFGGPGLDPSGEVVAGFHVIKNLFKHRKVRYRRLSKNTAQLYSLFALANLVIARRALLNAANP